MRVNLWGLVLFMVSAMVAFSHDLLGQETGEFWTSNFWLVAMFFGIVFMVEGFFVAISHHRLRQQIKNLEKSLSDAQLKS